VTGWPWGSDRGTTATSAAMASGPRSRRSPALRPNGPSPPERPGGRRYLLDCDSHDRHADMHHTPFLQPATEHDAGQQRRTLDRDLASGAHVPMRRIATLATRRPEPGRGRPGKNPPLSPNRSISSDSGAAEEADIKPAASLDRHGNGLNRLSTPSRPGRRPRR